MHPQNTRFSIQTLISQKDAAKNFRIFFKKRHPETARFSIENNDILLSNQNVTESSRTKQNNTNKEKPDRQTKG